MSKELQSAVVFLIDLIQMGVEYPDAQFQTTLSYEVDSDTLQTAYDNYCLTHDIFA